MVLGEKETVLYGKGYIEDELCGHTFRISSKSFYQVNPVQTEKLYAKAIELAGLTGKERVIDAYCGIGTIGLIASDKAKMRDSTVMMQVCLCARWPMKAKVWMLYSWIRHAAEVTRSFCPL